MRWVKGLIGGVGVGGGGGGGGGGGSYVNTTPDWFVGGGGVGIVPQSTLRLVG